MSEPFERAVDAAIDAILDAGGTIDFRVQDVVRAAIAAMRLPTQEMIEAEMSEMVERVVVSIGELIDADEPYEVIARAAIAAMREPTEEMHRAAKEKRDADKANGKPTSWGTVYQAMIDEMLK